MSDNHSVRFPRLNDSNYAEWSVRMEAYLIRKKLWKVVNITEEGKTATALEDELKARGQDEIAEARAEMILLVEDGQLSHMRSSDPREIWLTLQRVHRAAGFATSLALRRRFLTMKKADESMQSWIGTVKALAFRLEQAGIDVSAQDVILALTMGLPKSYDAVIINFDATATESLTLDHVITRLLNEETRQKSATDTSVKEEERDEAMAATSSRGRRSKGGGVPSDVICFWCDKPGHYKSECPDRLDYEKYKEKKASGSALAVFEGSDSDSDTAL